MRYLILSDIHANWPALEAVLADAGDWDAVLCLGDVVGYGAQPREVIAAIAKLAPQAIVRGNHDKVCAGLEPPSTFNAAARDAVVWTIDALTPADLAWLAALPRGPSQVDDVISICHGAPFDEDAYLFDGSDVQRLAGAMTTRLCLFGHTHVPTVISDELLRPPARLGPSRQLVTLPTSGHTLVNVGAVGQPRDGDPRAAYGVIDTERHTVEICRAAYDIARAQRAIRAAGLPDWLAVRLERGQ